ncbi:hypothetical protein SAMN06264365_122111 [Actinoplanes regularis]|uniref:Uncharacterized protein n=1 Tax=Actinoplanes regularis TaxID=52697 RepID=A0A239GY58_9ACTN|nr:hypothetical protein SAMN06264365_122111 [Actinoplanes regularis]
MPTPTCRRPRRRAPHRWRYGPDVTAGRPPDVPGGRMRRSRRLAAAPTMSRSVMSTGWVPGRSRSAGRYTAASSRSGAPATAAISLGSARLPGPAREPRVPRFGGPGAARGSQLAGDGGEHGLHDQFALLYAFGFGAHVGPEGAGGRIVRGGPPCVAGMPVLHPADGQRSESQATISVVDLEFADQAARPPPAAAASSSGCPRPRLSWQPSGDPVHGQRAGYSSPSLSGRRCPWRYRHGVTASSRRICPFTVGRIG